MRKSRFYLYRKRLNFFKNERKFFEKIIDQTLKGQSTYCLKEEKVIDGKNEGDFYATFVKNGKQKEHTSNYVRFEYNGKTKNIDIIFYTGPKLRVENESSLAKHECVKITKARTSELRKSIRQWFATEDKSYAPYKITVSFHTQFEMIRYDNVFYNSTTESSYLVPEIVEDIIAKEINKRTYREICELCNSYRRPTQLAYNTLRCKVISLETDIEVEGAGGFVESELGNQLYQQILKYKEMKREKPKKTLFHQKLFNFLLYLRLRRFARLM
jgi:hypothetical protein